MRFASTEKISRSPRANSNCSRFSLRIHGRSSRASSSTNGSGVSLAIATRSPSILDACAKRLRRTRHIRSTSSPSGGSVTASKESAGGEPESDVVDLAHTQVAGVGARDSGRCTGLGHGRNCLSPARWLLFIPGRRDRPDPWQRCQLERSAMANDHAGSIFVARHRFPVDREWTNDIQYQSRSIERFECARRTTCRKDQPVPVEPGAVVLYLFEPVSGRSPEFMVSALHWLDHAHSDADRHSLVSGSYGAAPAR